ncbi:MAG: ribonuclease HII [Bryobacterales bacterium]|nr:ribonuclease HII [Bryobacterales bacterium]
MNPPPQHPRRLGLDPIWEAALRKEGYSSIAGVDEAGRGCLFGPVVAAAVILAHPHRLPGVDDSKKLSDPERERLYDLIIKRAVAWSVASVEAAVIDRINILEASRLAMRWAVERLPVPADALLVDALEIEVTLPQRSIIHGDGVCRSIAAASILAKVHRDRTMREWDRLYPGYAIASNKGYGTPSHVEALEKFGPTPEHRFSYRPVQDCCHSAPCIGWRDPQQLLF